MARLSGAILYVTAACSFALTAWLGESIRQNPPRDQFLVPPPETIEHFALGFRDLMADSFWLRWIQDADTCQTYLKPVEKIDPAAQTKSQGDRFFDPRKRNCDISWSFKMLDAVTKLAPKFLVPYQAGGISLSVLTEDYAGATLLFNRGLENFPDDWSLAYRAAYHFMIDVHDRTRAGELLSLAAAHGAPSWVNSLASRLYLESGQVELALRTLLAYRKTMVGERGVAEIEARIAALRRRLSGQ